MAAPKLSSVPVYSEPEVANTTIADPPELSSKLTEHRILLALGDTSWDWRTLDGLQRSTNLPVDVVYQWLVHHSEKIEEMHTPDHGVVFRLRDQRRSANERFYLWLDKVLDYVSFGKRSHSA